MKCGLTVSGFDSVSVCVSNVNEVQNLYNIIEGDVSSTLNSA